VTHQGSRRWRRGRDGKVEEANGSGRDYNEGYHCHGTCLPHFENVYGSRW